MKIKTELEIIVEKFAKVGSSEQKRKVFLKMSEMRKVVRKQPDRNVKTRRQNIEEPGKISGRMEDLYQRFPHLSELFDSLDNRSLFA